MVLELAVSITWARAHSQDAPDAFIGGFLTMIGEEPVARRMVDTARAADHPRVDGFAGQRGACAQHWEPGMSGSQGQQCASNEKMAGCQPMGAP